MVKLKESKKPWIRYKCSKKRAIPRFSLANGKFCSAAWKSVCCGILLALVVSNEPDDANHRCWRPWAEATDTVVDQIVWSVSRTRVMWSWRRSPEIRRACHILDWLEMLEVNGDTTQNRIAAVQPGHSKAWQASKARVASVVRDCLIDFSWRSWKKLVQQVDAVLCTCRWLGNVDWIVC